MNLKKKKSGFTIIEVVLVLAIAGLIFIMVFAALPALQRNQRDTDRKNDVARVLAALQSYQSNNRGYLPTNSQADLESFAKYLEGTYRAGSGTAPNAVPAGVELAGGKVVTFLNGPSGSLNVKDNQKTETLNVYRAAKCGASAGVVEPGSSRQVAVLIKLETGDAVYCSAS